MSGIYAAVLPLFPGLLAEPEVRDDTPTLDDSICALRWLHPEMIENLDARMQRQIEMVETILAEKGWTVDQLTSIVPSKAYQLEEVLQLCYHILRDVAYIDTLR